ncbi:hypothetical protein JTB14_002886 [Gonioctena quinquepunctata]|nr:hypothetical protein JTB14_002886 [Gonioctena quinquepunctata]
MLKQLLLTFLFTHNEIISGDLTKNLRAELQTQTVFENFFANVIQKEISNSFNIIIQSGRKLIDFPLPYLGKTDMNFEHIHTLKDFENAPSSFIIGYENLERLNNTLLEISSANFFWKPHLMRYIIVLEFKDDLQPIIELLWLFKYYKTVVLVKSRSGARMYTIGFAQCGNSVKPLKIKKIKKETSIFDIDMKKNFRRCPFKVIWSRMPPWIFHVNSTEPGILIDVMEIFRDASGFDVIYMPENDAYYKELVEYFSFDSIMDDFDDGRADIFLGLSVYLGFLRVSQVSFIDSFLYILAPIPDKIPYWRNIMLIFSSSSWVLIIGTFCFVAIVFHCLASNSDENFGSSTDNFFHVFTMSLNLGIHKVPNTTKLRTLIGSYILCSLILCAVSQGKLYSFISRPPLEKPIRSLEGLLTSDIPVKLVEAIRMMFTFMDQTHDKLLEKADTLPSNSTMLENANRAFREKFATGVDGGVMILQPSLKHTMQYFPTANFMMCLYMPFDHALQEYFEKTLRRIVESGFLDQSISKLKFIYAIRSAVEEEERVFSLSLVQMEAAFFILIIGLSLALVVFVLEHVIAFLTIT